MSDEIIKKGLDLKDGECEKIDGNVLCNVDGEIKKLKMRE